PYTLLNSGYLWATPALADVENRVVALAADLVTRYHVDGLHLDLVRYPGPNYSCDPFTEAALVESGLPRADWQRQRVTQLVSRVYSDVIVPRPGVRLSAAVWPVYQDHWDWGYSEGYSDYYQDSQGWIGSGVIDAILPMIYPANVFESWDKFTLGQFSISASDFLDSDGGRHVFPGISAQYASFAEIAQRIAIARDLGAPGHAIFSARLVTGDYWCAGRAVCHDPYWDDFAAGPYATPARIPPLTWRW
ncbi:MAG: family 10 glycosylhydrolase, partial [Anaerolineae bacterium]